MSGKGFEEADVRLYYMYKRYMSGTHVPEQMKLHLIMAASNPGRHCTWDVDLAWLLHLKKSHIKSINTPQAGQKSRKF